LGESLADCEIMNIRQEKWQGHECYFIEAIQSNGAKAEVWIDPEIGWRARCVRYWGPDGTIWHEASAEFKDCGNGAWFPVQGVYKLYGNDPNSGERVVSDERKLKVEQVKVNTDLTQKDFEIQYPRGTRVYLFDTGESYIAGVTSVAGFGEEALNPLKDKALPDMKQFAVELDPNQTKDKMILVCFFDMNQRPSRNCMRQLSAKAQELTAKDVVVVAVQASKVDEDKLNDWVKKNNIPFPVGMVQSDEEKTRFAWGVRSLPWLSLTDTQHVVIAEGFYLDELGDKLNGNSQ
jgi:peroxiredoxin